MMTIRQLATVLGLSKSTVAAALRGMPNVKVETREWVQRQAVELGYIPNPIASAFLSQVRTQGVQAYRGNLVFLMPIKVQRPYLIALQQGARERAAELGYGLDVLPAGDSSGVSMTRLLLARGVLGIIVGPLARDIGHLSLNWSKFAAVTYGYSMAQPPLHRIVHHHMQGIRTIFRMCRHKGFRRIGLALRREADKRSNLQWSSSFLGLQATLPEAERVPPLLSPGSSFSPEQIVVWIRREKPEVVIIHNSDLLEEISRRLKGVRRSVSFVVLDRKADDCLAGIDQQFKWCGKMLVDSLSSQIFHNKRGIPDMPIVSMVDGMWVPHPSLGRGAAAKETRVGMETKNRRVVKPGSNAAI